ncbi:unnamed protein product [Rotaria sp. Silwood1]|nr:unnamed protein product [Rotaria sp. Silwood1]CAF1061740.1 unnamed protein product [Rotaria sp. Silwood1]CAF3380386.1 unnamed protein product [Rotaria sp. Silwood1]CAF4569956.1 unnamed protein product [Rotaria sp. Silwood1]CAF4604782.1 unnamed protein product [Rotaria sp. Silwood1]
MTSGELALPLTVYRGQTKMANDELKKIEENIDGLISMHTFLSTTVHYNVAYDYVFGADPDTTVIFQITVKDTEQGKRMNTFARISQKSSFKDEEEVLFGVSSVFRIISVQQEYCFWFIELESTTFKEDETVQRFMSEIQTYLYQSSVYTLLVSASMQYGDLDSAEYYCLRAVAYKSTNIGAQAIHILRQIPELKMVAQYNGPDFIREMISGNLQSVQQLISQIHPHSSTISGLNNEETWTFEKFITVADHYRHRKDNEHAELYYSKALDKMTEAESKSMWNVYRKMVRMGSNSDQYQDYFIKQFSKYDDNNPNHFSMIATLQTILTIA